MAGVSIETSKRFRQYQRISFHWFHSLYQKSIRISFFQTWTSQKIFFPTTEHTQRTCPSWVSSCDKCDESGFALGLGGFECGFNSSTHSTFHIWDCHFYIVVFRRIQLKIVLVVLWGCLSKLERFQRRRRFNRTSKGGCTSCSKDPKKIQRLDLCTVAVFRVTEESDERWGRRCRRNLVLKNQRRWKQVRALPCAARSDWSIQLEVREAIRSCCVQVEVLITQTLNINQLLTLLNWSIYYLHAVSFHNVYL